MEVDTATEMAKIAPPPFDKPLGHDCPPDLWTKAITWRPCQVTVGDKLFSGKYHVVLESQQPRVAFKLHNKARGQVIFTAKNCSIETGFEQDEVDFVNQHRGQFDLKGGLLSFIKIRPSAPAAMPSKATDEPSDQAERENWQALNSVHWQDSETVIWVPYEQKSIRNCQSVFDGLEQLANIVRKTVDGQEEPVPRAWWFYARNPVPENADRSPAMPWLFDKEGRYRELTPHDPWFIDEEDRSSILVAATLNERDYQRASISEIFNLERVHKARLRKAGRNDWWYVDVTVDAQKFPTLSASTMVKFAIRNPDIPDNTLRVQDLNLQGFVISDDDSFKADFTMFVRGEVQDIDATQDLAITAFVSPNLLPVNEQLEALEAVSRTKCFGDLPGNKQKGYSLRKVVLGHGREVDPYSDDYFEVDLREASPVDTTTQAEYLRRIEQLVPLDVPQTEAVKKSTFAIPGGVHLVVGPPGTGKTRTAKRIILTLASLGLKVLVTAGSNKGVDNLFHPVFQATRNDQELRAWCGPIVRFRSPAYQFATIRQDSARRVPNQTPELSDVECEIEKCQIHTLVQKLAQRTPNDEWSSVFLTLLEKDRVSGVRGQEEIQFREAYDRLMQRVFSMGNIRVVATTLSNSAQEALRLTFHPDVVICDESGQCLEGDHMIPLTKNADYVRAVILLGDPDQLPPTVTSEGQLNEGAQYLKRSLMARLLECGYPSTLLNVNYRNHQQILELFNRTIYKSKLRPGPSNSEPERVGDTWDEFTSKRHHFHGQLLAGVRRLFISVIGTATREEHGTSFQNVSQAVVIRDVLAELYSFSTAGGQSIRAEDVMIISPYKAQRRLISRTLSQSGLTVRDNLTVDAAQGQEAPIVLLSLTKPGEVATSLGFMANKERLNVALSRAQKVLIVVGNLTLWGEEFVKSLGTKNNSVKVLRDILVDVRQKNHVLTWVDKRVVTEVVPDSSYVYYSHIRPPMPAYQPRHTISISNQDAMEIDDFDQVLPATRHASQGGILPRVSLPSRPPLPMAEQQMRMDDLQDLEARRQVSREEFRRLQEQAAMSQTEVQWYDKQMQDLRRKRGGRDERSRSPRR